MITIGFELQVSRAGESVVYYLYLVSYSKEDMSILYKKEVYTGDIQGVIDITTAHLKSFDRAIH